MSATNALLQRFGMNLGVSAFKRKIEEVTEPILERAIRSGMSENETAREIIMATRDIPGIRVGGYALVSAAGSLMSEYADDLWPGDNRTMTRTMRTVLKRVGPNLHFASDIAADALEKAVMGHVDDVVSPPTIATADRKGVLDAGVFLWPDEFPNEILVPAHNDDGTIRYDTHNVPVLLHAPAMKRRHSDKYTRGKQRMTGQGKNRKSVTDPPDRPNIIGPFALKDAVLMVDIDRMDPGAADAIRKALAPKPGYFSTWGDDVWGVIRAYNLTLSRRMASTGYDWLDHEESEGLVETMIAGKPDVTLLKELLGKAYKSRIGQNGAAPGEFTLDDIDAIEQVVFDMWLKGEQPKVVKMLRSARRVRRSAALRGTSPFQALLAAASLTLPIWFGVAAMFVLFLIALIMYGSGVTTPVNAVGKTLLWQGPMTGVQYILVTSILASWTIFVLMQVMNLAHAATAWIATVIPAWKEESVVGFTRKVRIFGFLLPTLSAYIALLGGPIEARLMAVLPVGAAIAIGSMMVDAGYRYKVERAVDRMSGPMSLVLTIIPLGISFIWGPFLTHGSMLTPFWVWFTGLFSHWMGQLVLLVIGTLLVGTIFGKLDRQRRAPTWIMSVTALIGIIWILVNAFSGVGGSTASTAAPTTAAPTQTQSAPAPAATQKPSLKELCDANQVDFQTCRDAGYK